MPAPRHYIRKEYLKVLKGSANRNPVYIDVWAGPDVLLGSDGTIKYYYLYELKRNAHQIGLYKKNGEFAPYLNISAWKGLRKGKEGGFLNEIFTYDRKSGTISLRDPKNTTTKRVKYNNDNIDVLRPWEVWHPSLVSPIILYEMQIAWAITTGYITSEIHPLFANDGNPACNLIENIAWDEPPFGISIKKAPQLAYRIPAFGKHHSESNSSRNTSTLKRYEDYKTLQEATSALQRKIENTKDLPSIEPLYPSKQAVRYAVKPKDNVSEDDWQVYRWCYDFHDLGMNRPSLKRNVRPRKVKSVGQRPLDIIRYKYLQEPEDTLRQSEIDWMSRFQLRHYYDNEMSQSLIETGFPEYEWFLKLVGDIINKNTSIKERQYSETVRVTVILSPSIDRGKSYIHPEQPGNTEGHPELLLVNSNRLPVITVVNSPLSWIKDVFRLMMVENDTPIIPAFASVILKRKKTSAMQHPYSRLKTRLYASALHAKLIRSAVRRADRLIERGYPKPPLTQVYQYLNRQLPILDDCLMLNEMDLDIHPQDEWVIGSMEHEFERGESHEKVSIFNGERVLNIGRFAPVNTLY